MEGLKATATDRESESCPDRNGKMSIVKERPVTISRTISHRKMPGADHLEWHTDLGQTKRKTGEKNLSSLFLHSCRHQRSVQELQNSVCKIIVV